MDKKSASRYPVGTRGWAVCDSQGTMFEEPLQVTVQGHLCCPGGCEHLVVVIEDEPTLVDPEDFFLEQDQALAALALYHLDALEDIAKELFPQAGDLRKATEVYRASLQALRGDDDVGQA